MEDRFDLDNVILTKAVFSYAIAVMDRLRGWEEEEGEHENWVGQDSRRACGSTQNAAVCNRQNHMQNSRIFK